MINNNNNFLSKIISLVVVFVIFILLFLSFWSMFFQHFFNRENREAILAILVAIIFFGFLLAYTVSNSHKPFSWQSFITRKSPTELKLIACECWARAGMLEEEIAKQLEDRMKEIDDKHNFELNKIKAGLSNKK